MDRHAGKHKKRYIGHMHDLPPQTYLIHVPGHSSNNCKVHINFGKKYTSGRPSKKQDRKQEVDYMVNIAVDEILQENTDKNMITKVDSNYYHEGENLEEVEYDTEL